MGLFDGIVGGVTNNLKHQAEQEISRKITDQITDAAKISTSKKCPKCKAVLASPPGKFCAKCGTTLMKSCPKCKNEFVFDTVFCSSCGTKL